jgi:hypothetical protein
MRFANSAGLDQRGYADEARNVVRFGGQHGIEASKSYVEYQGKDRRIHQVDVARAKFARDLARHMFHGGWRVKS